MSSLTQVEITKSFGKSTARGVVVFAVDLVLFGAFTFLAVWLTAWWLQLFFSLLSATMIAVLFVVGHDASHGSLTPNRRLNRFIGTVSLLPSMHPYSLWVKLHNLRHHHWTCLVGKDDVWAPCDMAMYQSLPWISRRLYRFYRGPFGLLLYYLIEFWWKKFSWPTKKYYTTVKRQYVTDTLLVWGVAAAFVGLLVYSASAGWLGGVERAWWNPILFGVVIPFFVWNVYSGASIYLHHTHPKTVWYKDEEEWRQVSKAHTSVHAVFPPIVQRLFHFIQEHSIHHLRPGVPLYHLAEAQSQLEEADNGQMIVYRWSLAYHGNINRRCKLFDFEAKRWMDFDGNYTSPAPKKRIVAPVADGAAPAGV